MFVAAAELCAQAVEACPLPVAFLDTEARHCAANEAYLRWLGHNRSEVLGRTVSEVLGRKIADEVAPYVQVALAGGSVTFEKAIANRRRGVRRMLAQYTAATGSEGETVGFFAYLTDVTDRQEAEEAVALALDGLGDGYLAVSRDLRFTYVNSAAARFYDKARHEILGRHLESVFPGALDSAAGAVLRRVLDTRHPSRAIVPAAGSGDADILLEIVPLKGGGAGVVIQSMEAEWAPLPSSDRTDQRNAVGSP